MQPSAMEKELLPVAHQHQLQSQQKHALPIKQTCRVNSPRPLTSSQKTSVSSLLDGFLVWMTNAYCAGTTRCTSTAMRTSSKFRPTCDRLKQNAHQLGQSYVHLGMHYEHTSSVTINAYWVLMNNAASTRIATS